MPSLDSTYHMCSTEQFNRIRDGVILVNCARGSVVDENALYEALVSGKVAGAGLDVMEKEPFNTENRLFSLKNVIFTPHVAGVTAEASGRTHMMVVDTTLKLLDGIMIHNVANKEALNHERWSELKR